MPGLAVGQPLAKVPYSLVTDKNVKGLPSFKHPAMMSHDELKFVYDNIDEVQFVGELSLVKAGLHCLAVKVQLTTPTWELESFFVPLQVT